MSWQQELKDLEFADSQDPDEVTGVVQAYRWFTTALHNIYLVSHFHSLEIHYSPNTFLT